jgi:tetratricopeptide (TPR) repeat protein
LLGRVSLLSCGLNRQKHLISRGALAQDLDKLTSAHDELTQAISWLASNPVRRIAYRETLGGAYMNRGSVVAESGRPAAAIPDFDAALNIVTWPFGIGRPRGVIRGDILTNRGSANRDLGHLSVAITDATDALDTYRQCLQRGSFPQPLLHRRIATVLMNRGNAMANARQYDSAASDYSAALAEISQVSGEEGGRVGALRALIRVAEGQRFQDIAEWQKSTIEYTVAVDTLSELVRQGSEDIRTTLALALANRAVSYIALDELQAASDDIDAAQRIYDRASWESSSRLAVWVAANQTALAGLGSLLRKEIAIGDKRADVFQSWKVLSSRQGNYVLAPFVRATTGIARLAFPRAPRFSADAVVECVAMIEEGTGEGYWSEWLVAEVKDLHAFVQAQAAQMTSFGVSVDQIARVTKNLEDRAKQGRGGSHVLN